MGTPSGLGQGPGITGGRTKAGALGEPSGCITIGQAETRPASLTYWGEAYRCGDDYCNGAADATHHRLPGAR